MNGLIKTIKRTVLSFLIALTVTVCWAQSGSASVFYGFDPITNNHADIDPLLVYDLALDFLLEVDVPGTDLASFKFYNNGDPGETHSITDIYFYDGDVIDSSYDPTVTVSSTDGVSFSEGAAPGHLPGYPSESTASIVYLSDSDNPVPKYGVNPGEWIEFTFTTFTGTDIYSALLSTDLVVGIHVQGYDTGFSESFVNHQPVPVPPSLWLMGSGLLGLIFLRRSSMA